VYHLLSVNLISFSIREQKKQHGTPTDGRNAKRSSKKSRCLKDPTLSTTLTAVRSRILQQQRGKSNLSVDNGVDSKVKDQAPLMTLGALFIGGLLIGGFGDRI